jgi:hypothetical protein
MFSYTLLNIWHQFATSLFRLPFFLFAAYFCQLKGNAFYTFSLQFNFIFRLITLTILYPTPFRSTIKSQSFLKIYEFYFWFVCHLKYCKLTLLITRKSILFLRILPSINFRKFEMNQCRRNAWILAWKWV